MEADEMEPWTRDERGQALHELQRRHHDMGGAVVVGAFELQHDIAGTVACQSFVGNSGAGDVATQCCVLGAPSRAYPWPWLSRFLRSWAAQHTSAWRLKPCALTQRGRWRLSCRDGLEAQHFLPCPGPERNAVVQAACSPGPEGGLGNGVGLVAHPRLLDEIAPARQELHGNFDCKWEPEGTWRSKKVSAGKMAFSEPEARVIRDSAVAKRPDAVVFWPSQANAMYASECEDGIYPETLAITKVYAKAAGYQAVESFDAYEVHGDAEGWLASIGIPAITVELKTHETIEWEKNLAGVTALIRYYAGT